MTIRNLSAVYCVMLVHVIFSLIHLVIFTFLLIICVFPWWGSVCFSWGNVFWCFFLGYFEFWLSVPLQECSWLTGKTCLWNGMVHVEWQVKLCLL